MNEPKKPPPKPLHYDIQKTISVDSTVLNFGNFYPEKLLGSLLSVSNQTKQDQMVNLTIDSTSDVYCVNDTVSKNPEFKYMNELIS